MTTLAADQKVADRVEREPFRADIQGLRAIAVLLVLLYHLWPDRITGGYIGVDVFFVISGFLITNHLAQRPPRVPRDFLAFWGKRIRRLLPASLLVIVVTAVAGSLLLPVTMLAPLGQQAVASALYVENWVLAANSIDYLGAQAAPSALQHYWSLSVEEQFYVLWPFIVALGALLARRAGRRALLVTVAALVAVSFVISIVWTYREPASAYFATPTRLWELGAGGIAAVLSTHTRTIAAGARIGAAWAGIVLIGVSAFLLTASTPFPGYWALLPVAGALLVILANAPRGRFSSTSVLGWRPVQFVGDNSYSIYLWHWPIIVIVTANVGELTIWHKVPIIVGSLLLAALTKRFVEDPVRENRWLRTGVMRTFVIAAVVTALVVASAAIPTRTAAAAVEREQAQRQAIIDANGDCFGAGTLAEGSDCGDPHGTGILPSPANALTDLSDAYDDGCFNEKPFPGLITCTYGDTESPSIKIALVGNSHAAQWLPAVQELAADRDAEIVTFIASGCMPTSAIIKFDTELSNTGCHDWGQRVVDETSSGDYDLIVTSDATNSDLAGVDPADKFAPQVDGLADVFQAWSDAGVPVLVIRDTPLPFFDLPQCVASNTSNLSACDGKRSAWEFPDPLVSAAERVGDDISVVDLNDHLCDSTTCYGVLGGVLVYFDYMHVGATFIRTMSPYLAGPLDAALAR